MDYVLFEAAGLIKEALIRDWSLLQESDILSLRQYLLEYVLNHLSLASFVRERILQVIAVMVKRGSVEDFGIERSSIVAEIENLIINGDTVKVYRLVILFGIFCMCFIFFRNTWGAVLSLH